MRQIVLTLKILFYRSHQKLRKMNDIGIFGILVSVSMKRIKSMKSFFLIIPFEMSSLRKISRVLYNELMISFINRLTSVLKRKEEEEEEEEEGSVINRSVSQLLKY